MAFFAVHSHHSMATPIADPQLRRRQGYSLALGLFSITFIVAWYANHYRMDGILTHGSDPWGYYQFLPALLGTHEWAHLPWAYGLENGNALSLFSMGVAMLMLPFFLMGALASLSFGFPVDGYSLPFVFAYFSATAAYTALGCQLLFQALRRRFPVWVSLVTPIVLFGTTNLFFYSTHEPGMSHVYSFFLFAWLYYLTVRMLEAPRGDRLIGLFICAALIVLVRQLNVVALLFPLLYGDPYREALRKRSYWLRQFPGAAVAGTLLAIAVVTPQLMYWRHITGQLLVFTYGKKGEGFTWTEPHLWEVLFSHQNGWFIYTPIMLLVMGVLLVQGIRHVRDMRLVLAIWTVSWYVYASWWSWWLGGSFGHRGFIEHYALLAIPFAWGLDRIVQRGTLLRDLSVGVLLMFAYLNIRLSFLYFWPWEGPDWNWEKLISVMRTAVTG
jgi:hypothetical protein